MIEEYRDYKIWSNTKTMEHHNKVSGHSWTTQEPMKGFYVSGKGVSVNDSFTSIEKAKQHIDFVVKYKQHVDFLVK